MRILSIVTLAAVLTTGAAAAEPWEIVLREQLRTTMGCRAVNVSNVRVFELAGETVIDGHVDCEDGRAYDFSRAKEHLPFELRFCEPVAC